MSGDANASEELPAIAGPAADGFLFTFGPDHRKNPAAKATVEALKATGFEPEGYTLYTVAAVQVWAEDSLPTAAQARQRFAPVLSRQPQAAAAEPPSFQPAEGMSGVAEAMSVESTDFAALDSIPMPLDDRGTRRAPKPA